MNIKRKNFAGFTLIELMVASTIATIVLVVSFSLIGNIYFARKKIRIAQNFYSESRFLLEKIVTISRENTIDYDRYFEEVGPNDTSCTNFNSDQIVFQNSQLPSENQVSIQNEVSNRQKLRYPNIFYWKISDDIYRNLGGTKINGNIDPCAQAFDGTPKELYLINKSRNIRTAIRLDDSDINTTDERIQILVELGADKDNDGVMDKWSSNFTWNSSNECIIEQPYSDGSISPANILTSIQDEALCNSAHDWQNVSAKNLKISSFNFTPYPDRDPYLNFRNDVVQIHPNIFLFMKVDLSNYSDYGFENQPTITMQTSVSSRVYGNTRK